MSDLICTAEDLMSRGAVTIPASTSILRTAEILDDENIHGAPVVNTCGKAIGVVTRTDIVRYMHEDRMSDSSTAPMLEGVDEQIDLEEFGALRGSDEMESPVTEIMTTELVIASPETSAGVLASMMREQGVSRILIARGDELMGVVSASDLLLAVERYEKALLG